MRIITWNCRCGGFRKKARFIEPLKPDILGVQEVEPIDKIPLFEGESQPTYRDRFNSSIFTRRSIGVFSYSDLHLEAVDGPDPMFSFRRYQAQRGNLRFQVVVVWPYATKSMETSYRQAHAGFEQYGSWIRKMPTVVLGDFNNNQTFKRYGWDELLALTKDLDLVSAYHHYFKEDFGLETRPTHFHMGAENSVFHLDYCFVPGEWANKIKKVEVGTFNDWHQISDHVPVIMDLDL